MGLDSRFVLLPPIQEVLIDKDTGLPMSGGVVSFFYDNNRTALKPIYQISGNGPYGINSYVQINNPIILTSIGTFSDDNGNDIIPYLFPYQGTPDDSSGDVDLYYITVDNANGVRQFTREAWPNTTSGGTPPNSETLVNYVPNSQFILHNNNPPAATQLNYTGRNVNATYIAQGGWTYETNFGSTSTTLLTFPSVPNPDPNANTSASPPFYVNLNCTNPGSGDTFRDLCLEFPDVNKFASDDQNYTFSFQGLSNATPFNVNLFIVKYFGAGGSTLQQINLNQSITISSSYSIYTSSPFTFGLNSGMTISNGGDTWVKLIIRFPTSSTFNVSLTDFLLTAGSVNVTNFPPTPENVSLYQSTAGWLPRPNADGSSMYLPIVLTPQGMIYDSSDIGKINAGTYGVAKGAELFCNGQSIITNTWSSLGIPYYRLQAVLMASSPVTNIPLYGTGANFVTAYQYAGPTSVLRLTENTAGSITAPGGTNTTGFTVTKVSAGGANLNLFAYSNIAKTVLVTSNFAVPNAGASNGTTSFTVTDTNSYISGLGAQNFYSFTVLCVAGSAITGGQYFSFSNSTTSYNMWFKVNGVGSSPGGNAIEVDILSTFTAQDVANVVREAINQYQIYDITCTAASSITGGTGMTFLSNPASPINYYIWYQVGGVGTDPGLTGTPIQVTLAGTETAAQVVAITQLAINSYQYALPDLRGVFIRGLDSNPPNWDPDVLQRWSNVSGIAGAEIGTFEFEQFLSHVHNIQIYDASSMPAGAFIAEGIVTPTAYTQPTNAVGGLETRPVNIALNYYIKY